MSVNSPLISCPSYLEANYQYSRSLDMCLCLRDVEYTGSKEGRAIMHMVVEHTGMANHTFQGRRLGGNYIKLQ